MAARGLRHCLIGVLVSQLASIMLYAEPERLSMELKGTLGYASFPDESPLHHFVGGGSARFYFTPYVP
jgi:hypothetical protein